MCLSSCPDFRDLPRSPPLYMHLHVLHHGQSHCAAIMEVAKDFGKLGFPPSMAEKHMELSRAALYWKGMKSWWWLPTSGKRREAPLTSLVGDGGEGGHRMSHYGAFWPLSGCL